MRKLSIVFAIAIAILTMVLTSLAAFADGWPSVGLPL
jgi:hypothetical protein